MDTQKQQKQLTRAQRRKLLEFADKVADLAAASPEKEAKRGLNAVAAGLRRRWGFTHADKRRLVWLGLVDGATTVRDLVCELGLRTDDVSVAVQELREGGLVDVVMLQHHKQGRPRQFIRIKTDEFDEYTSVFPPK